MNAVAKDSTLALGRVFLLLGGGCGTLRLLKHVLVITWVAVARDQKMPTFFLIGDSGLFGSSSSSSSTAMSLSMGILNLAGRSLLSSSIMAFMCSRRRFSTWLWHSRRRCFLLSSPRSVATVCAGVTGLRYMVSTLHYAAHTDGFPNSPLKPTTLYTGPVAGHALRKYTRRASSCPHALAKVGVWDGDAVLVFKGQVGGRD